jgi:hypothetical protein
VFLITYNWVPDSGNNFSTSGQLTYSGSGNTLASFSFTFDGAGTSISFLGTVTVLSDGNLKLVGAEPDNSFYSFTSSAFGAPSSQENEFRYSKNTDDIEWGDWVPVGGRDSVPDGGMTVGLLGMALVGMSVIRRKLAK